MQQTKGMEVSRQGRRLRASVTEAPGGQGWRARLGREWVGLASYETAYEALMAARAERERRELAEMREATKRTPLQQAKECADLAKSAFAMGDKVVGIAAIVLAAQLTQLAKLQGHVE